MKEFMIILTASIVSIFAIVLVGLFVSPVLAAFIPVVAMVGTMLYIAVDGVVYNIRTKGL